MLAFEEALKDLLIVCLYIVIIAAAAGGLITVIAIVVGVIFACKDSMDQKKMDRLEDHVIEQAEKGLKDREDQKYDR